MTLAVFNSYSNWIVSWLDSYFSRNFTLDNITVWYIGSNFNSFISSTRHYLFTDFRTIFFFVDDCLSSVVSSVSNIYLWWLSFRSNYDTWNFTTSCIPRNSWDIYFIKSMRTIFWPIIVSYFISNFINCCSSCKGNSLSSSGLLTLWVCNRYFSSNCLVQIIISNVSNIRILARVSRHNSLVTDSLAIDQSCVSWNWRYIDRLNLSWVAFIVLVLGSRGALRIFIDYIA